MKLLLCLKCQDVFSLNRSLKTCGCGETKGRYIDKVSVEISGCCEPIGFANKSFLRALKAQTERNKNPVNDNFYGTEFTAFFISSRADSVLRVSQVKDNTNTDNTESKTGEDMCMYFDNEKRDWLQGLPNTDAK